MRFFRRASIDFFMILNFRICSGAILRISAALRGRADSSSSKGKAISCTRMPTIFEGPFAFYIFRRVRTKPTREVYGNSGKESRKGGIEGLAGLLLRGYEKKAGRYI